MSKDLLLACEQGNFKKVKDLLMNKQNPIDIHYCDIYNGNNALHRACANGHSNLVQYLLSSKDLKQHIDIHAQDFRGWNALIEACMRGNLDIVRYLLTSKELSEHANIHTHDEENHVNVLMYACMNGHLDIVKYLLSSEELKEHSDMYQKDMNQENCLIHACSHLHLNIAEYLIIEQHFKIDKQTMNWLVDNEKDEIINIIKTRDLYNKMNQQLPNSDRTIKQNKI